MRDVPGGATLPDMKRSLSAVLALIALFVVAAPAGAVAPEISRYGFIVTEQIDPAACGFPITAVVRGKGQTLLFYDGDGEPVRGLSTGPISVAFTNLSTGATARYSISGPSFYGADGELLRGTGRWYVFTAEGEPAIAVGNLTFGDGGVPQEPSTLIDVCDALS